MTNFLAITNWTNANLRARADYYLRPTRACPRGNCDQLANGRLCVRHEADNAASLNGIQRWVGQLEAPKTKPTPIKECADCNATINHRATRCRSCSLRHRQRKDDAA